MKKTVTLLVALALAAGVCSVATRELRKKGANAAAGKEKDANATAGKEKDANATAGKENGPKCRGTEN